MRTIDADNLKESIADMRDGYPVYREDDMVSVKTMAGIIDEAPTIEPDRPHGEWLEKPWGVVCSRCKSQAPHSPNGNQLKSDFCHVCGALMRKDCSCCTCKHWGENGAIDPTGEEYCPLDPFCENASLYEKMGGDEE